MKALRHSVEAALVRTARAHARLFGRRAARGLGRRLGSLWFRVSSIHRTVAEENLLRVYPDLPVERREALARASFRHFGELLVDLLAFARYDRARLEEIVEVEGWEHLERAHGRGRGVLVFSAHFGHWELVALLQGFRGVPMDLVARPLDNPSLDRQLARMRSRSGNRVIHKRSAVRGILGSLRERRSVGMVIDQNYGGTNPFFIDFLGHPAATTPTLGMLAVRTGAPVVPVFCWPGEDGRYRIAYMPEIPVPASGDRAADAYRVTCACTELIERQVRARPDLWAWMHQRWRTRPLESLPAELPARPALRYRRSAQG